MTRLILFFTVCCLVLASVALGLLISDKVSDSFVWVGYTPSSQCSGKTFSDMKYTVPLGVSMRPSIWSGNRVYYVPYNDSLPLVEGDVVRVRNDGDVIVHRVVGVYPEYFFLKGDNNFERDPVAYEYEDLDGVVCAVFYN